MSPANQLLRSLCWTALLAPLAVAQNAADSASIQKFYGEWMGAAMREGPAAYARYYASDGWILPPNAAPVQGRDAIARWMSTASANAPYLTSPKGIRVDEIRFLPSGMAVYRSTLSGTRVMKDGTASVAFETKYFDLLRHAADGGWEVMYRMWSDNPASGAPTPPPTVYFEFQVTKVATPMPGNKPPVYPQSLRIAQSEGEVMAQFVIDTLGRAEMNTFNVLRSTHAEFEVAVRDAVSQMRFSPAEVGNRKVRMLAQMPFNFRISP